MKCRIDKYLCDMSIGSRSEIKQYIKKHMVCINGEITDNPAAKVDTDIDTITFDGNIVSYSEYEYFILNKPAGVVSATTDPCETTVLDLISSKRKDLFPVGRLDKDTEGLLLITNDGELSHNLLSPKKHVDKTYYVEVEGVLTENIRIQFENGLQVDKDFLAMPAALELLSESTANITIREGKFHQIKRMMEAVGCKVTYLKRLRMGPLSLPDNLLPGQSRSLTQAEISLLRGDKC